MNLPHEMQAAFKEARARVRSPFPWWLRPLVARGVTAITLGRRVYLAAGVAPSAALLRHELVHVRQIARHGLVGFYWLYLSEYVRNRRAGLSAGDAYRAISFEREAAAAEGEDSRGL